LPIGSRDYRKTLFVACHAGKFREICTPQNAILLPLGKSKLLSTQAFQDERLSAILVCCLSGLAAFLAMVGLYGLMSFSLRKRIHEIGIRMALGAQTRTLLSMVIKQSVGLVLCGAGLGLIAAFLVTRLLASQLFGITATDPLTYAGVTFLLVFVALLACYLPARRAARADPILALRYE
jgi:putative ABC transport system permease protein